MKKSALRLLIIFKCFFSFKTDYANIMTFLDNEKLKKVSLNSNKNIFDLIYLIKNIQL